MTEEELEKRTEYMTEQGKRIYLKILMKKVNKLTLGVKYQNIQRSK